MHELTTHELVEKIREITDAGHWQHSWHWAWEGNRWGMKALAQAAGDLRCSGDPMDEGKEAVQAAMAADAAVRRRYALAREARNRLINWRAAQEAEATE